MKAQGRLLGMKGRGESRTRRDEGRRLLGDATMKTGKAAALGNAEDCGGLGGAGGVSECRPRPELDF